MNAPDGARADRLRLLADQRGDIRRLAAALPDCPPVDDERTGAELRRRQRLSTGLRRVFAGHVTLLSRFLWPAARRLSPASRPLVDDLVRLKKEIEEAMIKIEWSGDRDHARNREYGVVLSGVDRLLLGEEGIVAQVEEGLASPELARLESRMRRATGLLPTRPHPTLPAGRLAVAALGPLVGAVDRLRDRVDPPPSGS